MKYKIPPLRGTLAGTLTGSSLRQAECRWTCKLPRKYDQFRIHCLWEKSGKVTSWSILISVLNNFAVAKQSPSAECLLEVGI